MRRNALSLLLAIAISSTGCQMFGKKKAETWATPGEPVATNQVQDPYFPPVQPFQYTATTSDYALDESGANPAPPALIAPETRYHMVAPKETLFSIARSYYADQRRWKDIYAANATLIGGDPNRIYVGQRLRIP